MNQQLPVASPLQRVPLRVVDVKLLDRQGALKGYGKVELIDGETALRERPNIVGLTIDTDTL